MRADSLDGLTARELKRLEAELDNASISLWDADSAFSKRLPDSDRERLAQAYETTENLRTDVYRALARQANPCLTCEGEGQVGDDRETCPDCGGQGYVAKGAA